MVSGRSDSSLCALLGRSAAKTKWMCSPPSGQDATRRMVAGVDAQAPTCRARQRTSASTTTYDSHARWIPAVTSGDQATGHFIGGARYGTGRA
jgi:hypothetical protein